ncbi:MAG: extracellular solute-binding protein [Deltaproteobacteria bacterium]
MKKLCTILLVLLLGMLCAGTALGADLSFQAGGESYVPYPEALLQGGITMVPISVITDTLDIDAKANSKEGKISLVKNDSEVVIDSVNNQLTINGQSVKPQKDININEEHIYVPLRQVCEALGASVAWDAASRTIKITAPEDKNILIIFHAGSLKAPMASLKTEFLKTHPRARVYFESAGSLDCARKVTEGQQADIVASADYAVFDQLMIPKFTDWYVMFARNEMVLCYTDKSQYANEVNAKNWTDILLKKGVTYTHTNPDLDPAGYRALMVWQLAEKYNKQAGLYDKLVAGCPKDKVYDSAADLTAALKDGKVDYAFEYLSVAQQNGFKYVSLPAEINLSAYNQAAFYKNAKVVTTDSAKGTTAEQIGSPIIYALTVPNNAPNRALAMDFVKLVLSQQGQDIMTKAGQISISPAEYNDATKIPNELQ